jgi:hypothetical protein
MSPKQQRQRERRAEYLQSLWRSEPPLPLPKRNRNPRPYVYRSSGGGPAANRSLVPIASFEDVDNPLFVVDMYGDGVN